MDDLTIHRLRLRAPPMQVQTARIALEDALRTALPDERRLVLVRRITVAGNASTAQPRLTQRMVQTAWTAAVGDARHGGSDGANDANCVWFEEPRRSRCAAARAAAGRTPGVGVVLATGAARMAGRTSASVARRVSRSGDGRRRAADVARSGGNRTALRRGRSGDRRPIQSGWSPSTLERRARISDPSFHACRTARARTARNPRQGTGRLRRDLTASRFGFAATAPDCSRRYGAASGRRIARAIALHQSPALALMPSQLDALTELLVGLQSTGAEPRARHDRSVGAVPHFEPSIREPASTSPSAPVEPAPTPAEPHTARDPPRPAQSSVQSRDMPINVDHTAATPFAHGSRRPIASKHAGLWLVLPALIDVRFREWLVHHPELLGEHPGRQLIRAIGKRHQVPVDDPALTILGEPDEAPLADWAKLWARALNGWLRRNLRLRLHDLVSLPGRLHSADSRLEISLPIAAIDMRLRRRALDRDPGWTDWLGLSVYYRYTERDRPEGLS